jgi:ParB-like chromosome segregation protein Spo0J
MTNETEIVQIPLNKLIASDRNVRKTGGQTIDDIAASIQAHGLLHNLVVTKAKSDKYKVIAGAPCIGTVDSSTNSLGARSSK